MPGKIHQVVGIKGLVGDQWVPITLDASGKLSIGSLDSDGRTSPAIPTVLAGGAYVSGDAVGSIITFTNVAAEAGKGAVLKNLEILTLNTTGPALELWLFDRPFTPATDNDAFAVSDADLAYLVCVITTNNGDWFKDTSHAVASVEVSKRVIPFATSLYGQLVTRAGVTYAVGSIIVKLSCLRE